MYNNANKLFPKQSKAIFCTFLRPLLATVLLLLLDCYNRKKNTTIAWSISCLCGPLNYFASPSRVVRNRKTRKKVPCFAPSRLLLGSFCGVMSVCGAVMAIVVAISTSFRRKECYAKWGPRNRGINKEWSKNCRVIKINDTVARSSTGSPSSCGRCRRLEMVRNTQGLQSVCVCVCESRWRCAMHAVCAGVSLCRYRVWGAELSGKRQL